jgi:glyoxalase family protein
LVRRRVDRIKREAKEVSHLEASMPGIHHVTAICGDPVRNLRFYVRGLGLRLVKKTVNFDDPSTYHFYFGDRTGHPGTILTFFPWADAAAGQRGVGQASQTAFRVPLRSISYWTNRFVEKGISHQAPEKRFGETVLPFADQDGMALALVGIPDAENEPGWTSGDIPAEHAIRGLQGVTLLLDSAPKTATILTDVFGLNEIAREGSMIRFASAGDARGGVVDLHEAAGFPRHHRGRGSVHHVAFRASDEVQLVGMSGKLIRDHGQRPTEKKDRKYFRSIYFREPGGVLFEIATDIPGFAVDESVDALGRDLKLPGFLESRRAEIEGRLPLLETA